MWNILEETSIQGNNKGTRGAISELRDVFAALPRRACGFNIRRLLSNKSKLELRHPRKELGSCLQFLHKISASSACALSRLLFPCSTSNIQTASVRNEGVDVKKQNSEGARLVVPCAVHMRCMFDPGRSPIKLHQA